MRLFSPALKVAKVRCITQANIIDLAKLWLQPGLVLPGGDRCRGSRSLQHLRQSDLSVSPTGHITEPRSFSSKTAAFSLPSREED